MPALSYPLSAIPNSYLRCLGVLTDAYFLATLVRPQGSTREGS